MSPWRCSEDDDRASSTDQASIVIRDAADVLRELDAPEHLPSPVQDVELLPVPHPQSSCPDTDLFRRVGKIRQSAKVAVIPVKDRLVCVRDSKRACSINDRVYPLSAEPVCVGGVHRRATERAICHPMSRQERRPYPR